MTIHDLQPQCVWKYFHEITQIPRPSKHEEKILAYLVEFAKSHNLEYKQDSVGNTIIYKPATPGKENVPTIALQAHVDMVCEKNADKVHDFMVDPIETIVDGDWLKANGTTLGADDGMGVAIELAILASEDIAHGPIECLFTIDEETGITGAQNIAADLLRGKVLINLDSEDEGEVYVGCAGGCTTKIVMPIEKEDVPSGMLPIEIKVSGLKGGHSGGDIHLQRGNAVKIATRIAKHLMDCELFRLTTISGGNLHNAIAREAVLKGYVVNAKREDARIECNIIAAQLQDELQGVDEGLHVSLQTNDEIPQYVLEPAMAKRLVDALLATPHGVLAMSHDIEGLVETSVNLASIKETEEGFLVVTSQRSSTDSQKILAAQMVQSVWELAGAKVDTGDGYPGWKPNMNSKLLKHSIETYKRLFGKEPAVKAIHAGLECGLFLEKYPGLDMISVGPTFREVHSPNERVEIKTVAMFWDYVKDMISTFA
ncbi:MAG: aminoacyl-histidine dipeptidase [Bacteroidia bacterium]|nr:aminoacyl-histidine dipeptidase [Bacteroidia bacterium]